MSRLDSFIRRLSAQRDILNHVHGDLDLPAEGPIMEIGLGNGRTFNHLRELFPDRASYLDVYVQSGLVGPRSQASSSPMRSRPRLSVRASR